jgi:DNA replication terminus site-binding protein
MSYYGLVYIYTGMTMSQIAQLRADLANLKTHIQLLADLLEQQTLDATVYELPLWSEGDLGTEPDVIPVKSLTGNEAITRALLHLSDFSMAEDMPGVFAKRLPGTLLIECNQETELEIRGRIATINALKDSYAALIASISPHINTRFEVFKDAVPLTSKKAICRHIYTPDPQIRRLTYSWVRRKVGGVFTRDELLRDIAKAREFPTQYKTPEEWQRSLDIEEQTLMQYSMHAQFMEKRQTRITPMAMLTYAPEHKPAKTTAHTHSPFLIINDKPAIGALRTYLLADKDKKAEPTGELVLPRRSIYLLTDTGQLPTGSKRRLKT